PAFRAKGLRGRRRVGARRSGRSVGGAAGRAAGGRLAAAAWAAASAAAGTIDPAVAGLVSTAVVDRSGPLARDATDRASKATAAMGAAMAARRARSRLWASSSASPSVLPGAGGDGRSAGAGPVGGVPVGASGPLAPAARR